MKFTIRKKGAFVANAIGDRIERGACDRSFRFVWCRQYLICRIASRVTGTTVHDENGAEILPEQSEDARA
jgi:hypothetical protein